MYSIAAAFLCVGCAVPRGGGVAARSDVFQYHLDLPSKKGTRDAWLWIPPEAEQVRGVIVAGMTLMEQHFSKDQFIKWKDPYWVDAGTRYFFTGLKWVGDGQTLEVHPVYADRYPEQHKGQGPKWPKAGEPVTYSDAPIRVKVIAGPMVVTGPNTFRFQYSTLSPAGERSRSTFMAYSEGDAEHRYTEHVGMMPRGFSGLKKGKTQTITFPELSDVRARSKPIELKATSDAGVAVDYYVAYGPAVIEDGKLRITDIPKRAKFPIEVKVVACHFGSGVEPLIKTARPVGRILNIPE